MKPNYIGIVAGIIAFISIALPWWTMSVSGPWSVTANLNLWGEAWNGETRVTFEWWFTATAFALVIISGILGIVGSLIIGKTGKLILLGAGGLSILSLIIFVAGFSTHETFKDLNLFGGTGYSAYLSFGFWLALIAAILAFFSTQKHPAAPTEAPPTTES